MPSITPSRNVTASTQLGTDVVTATAIAAGAVDASELATDSVRADEIQANAVGDSEIASHTTTKITLPLANLANSGGAAGDIAYWNGSNWIRLAKGTATQVLGMNSGATAPEWEAPAAAPTDFFARFLKADGTVDGQIDQQFYVNFPDSSTTSAYTNFFMPSGGTISSILLVLKGGNTADTIKITYSFSSYVHGTAGAAESDSAALQSVTDAQPNNEHIEATVPSTAYDGLTRGRLWGVVVQRVGADAGDTAATSVEAIGLIVKFAA